MILPTDVELVEIAGQTSVAGAVPFCDVLGTSVVLFKTVRADGLTIFGIEGTHSPAGWILDFLALGAEGRHGLIHPDLGFVHAGFFSAYSLAFQKVLPFAKAGPVAFSGHSLGAVGALMLGAMCSIAGFPPVKVGAFAPPLGGAAQFVRIATSVPFCAYQFGQDIVPEVPEPAPPLFPFQQVPLTHLPASWTVNPLDIPARIAFHHFPNYDAGVKAVASAV